MLIQSFCAASIKVTLKKTLFSMNIRASYFQFSCLFLLLSLSPPICGAALGNYWWIFAILSIALPSFAYRQNISKSDWTLLNLLALPLLFFFYFCYLAYSWAMLNKAFNMPILLKETCLILLPYLVCFVFIRAALKRRNFEHDALALREKIDKEPADQVLLIKGVYVNSMKVAIAEMHFFVNVELRASAYLYTHTRLDFYIFCGEKDSYNFEKKNDRKDQSFTKQFSRMLNTFRRDYVLYLSDSNLEISSEGLITFPDGDSGSWDWDLARLKKGEIIIETVRKKKICIQLYNSKGAICVLRGERTKDLELSCMALMYFFFLLYSIENQ